MGRVQTIAVETEEEEANRLYEEWLEELAQKDFDEQEHELDLAYNEWVNREGAENDDF